MEVRAGGVQVGLRGEGGQESRGRWVDSHAINALFGRRVDWEEGERSGRGGVETLLASMTAVCW